MCDIRYLSDLHCLGVRSNDYRLVSLRKLSVVSNNEKVILSDVKGVVVVNF